MSTLKTQTCYKCQTELTARNSSEEHVIPNACGGRLKSNQLLCDTCNQELSIYDAELAKTTNVLANLLLIKRDRGEPPKIKVTTNESNQEYYWLFGGDMKMVKPEIKEIDIDNEDYSKRKIRITAPNTKILHQTLKGLKRKKHPNLIIDESFINVKQTRERLTEHVHLNSSIGGQESFKSVLKTAINFYMLNQGNREEIAELMKYFNQTEKVDNVWFHYPDKDVYSNPKNEVTHVIKLVGDPVKRILYCYIELFNSHCFLVKLSTDYGGSNIDVNYIFDVHSNETFQFPIDLYLSREKLINLFEHRDATPFSGVNKKMSRVMALADYYQRRHHFGKELDEITSRHLTGLSPGTYETKDVLLPMHNEILDLFREIFLKD